jgi:hypothetical protein
VKRQTAKEKELKDNVAAQDWSAVDAATRFVALHEINTAVMRWRERNGLEPIDDPLPGERESAYRLVKRILNLP